MRCCGLLKKEKKRVERNVESQRRGSGRRKGVCLKASSRSRGSYKVELRAPARVRRARKLKTRTQALWISVSQKADLRPRTMGTLTGKRTKERSKKERENEKNGEEEP